MPAHALGKSWEKMCLQTISGCYKSQVAVRQADEKEPSQSGSPKGGGILCGHRKAAPLLPNQAQLTKPIPRSSPKGRGVLGGHRQRLVRRLPLLHQPLAAGLVLPPQLAGLQEVVQGNDWHMWLGIGPLRVA